jgi:hypothetical protein
VRQVRRPARTPLTIRIKGQPAAEAHCANRELEDEFWRYCHTDENSDRVGEFAIGTNIGVRDVIGNILQDEKIPGVHIAFGNPYGAHTGATWYSSTHIDVVGRKFDIWADGRSSMCPANPTIRSSYRWISVWSASLPAKSFPSSSRSRHFHPCTPINRPSPACMWTPTALDGNLRHLLSGLDPEATTGQLLGQGHSWALTILKT